ncbi:MAG: hypothetical protein R3A10_18110 [Caldilineaceae bacterium]
MGSRGLGDLELSADGNTLYAVSPFNDQLVSLAVGSPPTAPGSAATTAIPRPANCPTAADFVPFALGVAPDTGMVYVGATCNARSTQNVANLRGYVYAWNPAGPFPNACGGLRPGLPALRGSRLMSGNRGRRPAP